MKRWSAVAGLAITFALTASACSSDDTAEDDNDSVESDEGSGTDDTGTDDTGSAATSGEIVMLSYNVAGLPQGISGSNPEANQPLIAPLLNDYELVLTQEDFATPEPNPLPVDFYHEILVAASDHEFIADAAIPPVLTDPTRPTAVAADGLNFFSRYPLGEVTRVRWDGCFGGADTNDGGAADCLSQKGFAMTRVTVADGVEIDVYNLHAEAGSTPMDNDLRTVHMEQLAAFINEHSEGNAVILGGDANMDSTTEPDATQWLGMLEATGLEDVCPSDCPEFDRIDKFAYRSSDAIELEPLDRRFEVDVFVTPDGEPLSDHEALKVTWRWTKR